MRLEALLVLALLALVLALRPVPVLAAVLLAGAERGRSKAVAFLAGWTAVLTVVGAVAATVIPGHHGASRRGAAAYAWADLSLGAAIAAYSAWRWHRRRRSGEPEPIPAWVGRIDAIPPVLAFGLGVVMPSYLVVAAAVNQMLETGWSGAGLTVMILLFVAVSSAGVAMPVAVPLLRPDGADVIDGRLRPWLLANRRPLMYLMSGTVAAVLMVKGLVGLLLG
ncbi:GAP family protein [Actinomadura fibrosa]|uniref:GAP family protein n=1 Tax=Actinomadura fibrosa TaxID=111802 RepID=A0ABW2XRG0_9ACTN|nr:GAP family protein [Actinomadura fibrosa]